MTATPIASIASADLVVIAPSTTNNNNNELKDAIASRSFISNVPCTEKHTPFAVLQAKSAKGVQDAIQYCAQNDLTVCVRSGGHSWETTWLQGSGSVLLDVGDINHITIDETDKSVRVGPAAKGNEVLKALPKHLFFPCGHCVGVPVGGFLLGGGFGIGFSRYGMSTMLVQAVEVVLADGCLVTAQEGSKDDPIQEAIMKLVKGSYTCFPGVVTSFTLGPLPDRPPDGVLSGMVVYKIQDWQKALDLGLRIANSEDEKDTAIETTVILSYAPPDLGQATGVEMVAITALAIFADSNAEGMALWKKYTQVVSDSLVPPGDAAVVPAEDLPQQFAPFYPPGARYKTEGFALADHSMPRAELISFLQPIADMWMSSDQKPPPPSHTLLVCVPDKFQARSNKGKEMVTAFSPAIVSLSYAIYQDESMDETMEGYLKKANAKMADHPSFKTFLVEGKTRVHGVASCFTEEAFGEMQKLTRLLDPKGLFGDMLAK